MTYLSVLSFVSWSGSPWWPQGCSHAVHQSLGTSLEIPARKEEEEGEEEDEGKEGEEERQRRHDGERGVTGGHTRPGAATYPP